MFVIIGIVIVISGVLGGYVLHGGPLLVLVQWSEFMIIGGASIGSLLISTPPSILKHVMSRALSIFRPNPYTKTEYLNLLRSMFELFNVATRDGLINTESHIENPEKSSIFTKNKFLLKNKHALHFFCDTMKLLLGGGVPAHDLEMLLDSDIETTHTEHAVVPTTIQKLGDSLPGLGIVAAVLGIVVTMQAINGPPEEIGFKVAAALVGTFLGVLLAYGFFLPMASHIEILNQADSRYLEVIKTGIVAYAKGNAPIMVVEFARRATFNDVRPTFSELEESIKALKSAPKA